AFLANKDRPGGTANRIPHKRDRHRAEAIGTPGPRQLDLRGEARSDLRWQAIVIEDRFLRLYVVGVELGEERVRLRQEADQLPGLVDRLAVGADAERTAAEECLRAVGISGMDRRRERHRLAGKALLENVDDLHADSIGNADDRSLAFNHVLDDLRCA